MRLCGAYAGPGMVSNSQQQHVQILYLQGLGDLLRCSRTNFVIIYKQTSKTFLSLLCNCAMYEDKTLAFQVPCSTT